MNRTILARRERWSGRTAARSLLGFCLLACLSPTSGLTADADPSWLRLERLNEEQRKTLDKGQKNYSDKVQPLKPPDQRRLNRQFSQQRRQQQLLQDKQRRERSLLRQRKRGGLESNALERPQLFVPRARRQQQNLQNRHRQQRRTWPYGRGD